MPTDTTNFGLLKPLVNSATDQDLWGGYLNTDMDEIDALIKTAMNFTPSDKTASFSVTAPTTGSDTTGSAKILYLCDTTSGDIVPSLPAASTCEGMVVGFKKTDAALHSVIVTANGAEKIDDATTKSLSAQYEWLIVESDGSGWNIISQTPPGLLGISNLPGEP